MFGNDLASALARRLSVELLEERLTPSYLTDLPFEPHAVNASGQVAGSVAAGLYSTHAGLWSPSPPNGIAGALIDLGTLGGQSSAAYGMNDAGGRRRHLPVRPRGAVSRPRVPLAGWRHGGFGDARRPFQLRVRREQRRAGRRRGRYRGRHHLPCFRLAERADDRPGNAPGRRRQRVSAVNDLGQVVGASGGRAFLWTSATGIRNSAACRVIL